MLGNLTSSDYDSLFYSKEFLGVKQGLREESCDVLCRFCDRFAYNVSLFARICNGLSLRWRLLVNVRDRAGFHQLIAGDILRLKQLLNLKLGSTQEKERID